MARNGVIAVACFVALFGTAVPAYAQCDNSQVTVGAGANVSNSCGLDGTAPPLETASTIVAPVIIGGDNATFTNDAGGSISSQFKLITGDNPDDTAIRSSNITINNAGTMEQLNSASATFGTFGTPEFHTLNGSGMFFSNPTGMSGIVVNNSGTIASDQFGSNCDGCFIDPDPRIQRNSNKDGRPISFEDGVNGAVVNNSGTITTAGGGVASSAAIGITGASNVTINNAAGGVLSSTSTGTSGSFDQGSSAILIGQSVVDDGFGNSVYSTTTANITINNAGTIRSGTPVSGLGAISVANAPIVAPNTWGNFAAPTNVTGITINNSGLIDGTNGGPSGVAIENSLNAAPITINSSGTITGDVKFGAGGGVLNLAAGSTVNTPSGLVVGSGVTVNAAGATINGDVHVAGGVFDPTITINGDLTVDTGVLLLHDGDLLSVDGNVTVGPNATIELVLGSLPSTIDLGSFFDVTPGHDLRIDGQLFSGGGILIGTSDPALIGKQVDVTFTDSAGNGFSADVAAAAVPEPASIGLLLVGLAGLGGLRRRRK